MHVPYGRNVSIAFIPSLQNCSLRKNLSCTNRLSQLFGREQLSTRVRWKWLRVKHEYAAGGAAGVSITSRHDVCRHGTWRCATSTFGSITIPTAADRLQQVLLQRIQAIGRNKTLARSNCFRSLLERKQTCPIHEYPCYSGSSLCYKIAARIRAWTKRWLLGNWYMRQNYQHPAWYSAATEEGHMLKRNHALS